LGESQAAMYFNVPSHSALLSLSLSLSLL